MENEDINLVEPPRRFHFDWLLQVLVRPRRIFRRIAAQPGAVWLTPLLLLTLTGVGQALAAGWVRGLAAASGEVTLPPGFEYYTPEQQAQFQQALQATSGPVFRYVFPALLSVAGVWLGWLVVSGLLHLVLTLLGGRGDTQAASNLVAWASLPLAVRDLVRIAVLLIGRQSIASPGLSGFAPIGETPGVVYLAAILALVDIYFLWHAGLLVLGGQQGSSLGLGKALGGTLITLLIVLAAQALGVYAFSSLGGLTIIRPFF